MSTAYEELEAKTFEKLRDIITELIGEDEVEILGIGRDSSFLQDLMIDSIRIVAFAEQVRVLYGDQVDFISWLSKKGAKDFLALTVGEVSGFIAGQISAASQEQ